MKNMKLFSLLLTLTMVFIRGRNLCDRRNRSPAGDRPL